MACLVFSCHTYIISSMRSHFEYTMTMITVNWIHLIEPHFKLIRVPESLWIYSIPQRYRSTVDDDNNLLSVLKLFSECCKPLSIAEIGAGSFAVICCQPNHSATSHSLIFTFTNIFLPSCCGGGIGVVSALGNCDKFVVRKKSSTLHV